MEKMFSKENKINKEKSLDEKMWDYYQENFIDSLAQSYPRQNLLFKKIFKKLPQGSKILEIGFGEGTLLNKLSKKYETYGADVSVDNIKRVRIKMPETNFKLIETDGKIPYNDNFFEGFIASEVLEHMSNKELEKCIEEIKRILRPNGYAIITVPAEENLKKSECFCPNCGKIFHKYGHKQIWNRKNIRKRFSNFNIVTIKEYYNPFVGKNLFDNVLGKIMWLAQTGINFITKFPNKFVTNRSYVIILKNDKK